MEVQKVNSWDYRSKKLELIDAAQIAYDILVDTLREPIDLQELGDDKIKAAIISKKVALLDAIDFLKEIESLETSVGIDTKKGVNLQEKKDWNQGIAERRAR